jgi:hypothetical protein
LPGVAVYWHFLSLDAPTVAVLWAWGFAHALKVGVSVSTIAVLGIGAWMIYVADRLLDARGGDDAALRERHFFHARHRSSFGVVLGAAGFALAWLIAVMPAQARRDDIVVFAASMLYFAAAHLSAVRFRRGFAREVAVGVLFASAAAVPAWSAEPVRGTLPIPVILFAGLCSLNCVAIETWERPEGAGKLSISVIAVGLATAALGAMLSTLSRYSAQARGEIHLAEAVLVSALLLLALDARYRKVMREATPERVARFLLALRIAADAALLTPLLFVLPWRL